MKFYTQKSQTKIFLELYSEFDLSSWKQRYVDSLCCNWLWTPCSVSLLLKVILSCNFVSLHYAILVVEIKLSTRWACYMSNRESKIDQKKRIKEMLIFSQRFYSIAKRQRYWGIQLLLKLIVTSIVYFAHET